MPTSSIKKHFVINSKTEASNLATMLQESLNKPYEVPKIRYKILTADEIKTLLYGTKMQS